MVTISRQLTHITNNNILLAPRRNSPTAWLDGLRGYAALLVFFCHFFFSYYTNSKYVYGTTPPLGAIVPNGTFVPYGGLEVWNGTEIVVSDPNENRNLLQLPILRLLLFGDAMVPIFFVVSGYALSVKPLFLIRKGPAANSDLLTSLASSIIRRPIRLLLPCITSTLVVLVAVRLGIYSYADGFAGAETVGEESFHLLFKGWAYESTPFIAPTLYEQLVDWCYSMNDLLDFFTHFHWTMTRYDLHLWTIPVELRCSLFLFLTIAGTAHLTTAARLIILAILILGGCSWGDVWEMSLFWAGMALCELDMIRDSGPSLAYRTLPKNENEDNDKDEPQQWPSEYWIPGLIVALYLLSYPTIFAEYTPFYSLLSSIYIRGLRKWDQFRIWHCIGAILLLACVSNSIKLKQFFSNRLARYLGRISYALYMVHGPINRSLGYSLAIQLWQVFGHDTQMGYDVAVFLTFAVVFPVTIYAADLFCKVVDEPIVSFARWVEGNLSVSDPRSRDKHRTPEIRIEDWEIDALGRGISPGLGISGYLEQQDF